MVTHPAREPIQQRAIHHELIDETDAGTISRTAVQRDDVLVTKTNTKFTQCSSIYQSINFYVAKVAELMLGPPETVS